MRRIFLIVLDSFGIGELPDAADYLDAGANTLRSVASSKFFHVSNLQKLGLFNIDGVDLLPKEPLPLGAFGRMTEISKGKDTTIGHWEIAGLESTKPLPTYPDGFPAEIISAFEKKIGCKVLCNRPYSGTEVIKDYGCEHVKTGRLIVYTSADSVFQIAAHEDVVPVDKLYEYCRIARDILAFPHNVGRVIARPFTGDYPNFTRTPNRHDFSLKPPCETMLTQLKNGNLEVISIGKINDVFAGCGVTRAIKATNNEEAIKKTLECLEENFEGLCFINLVDFDMLYGHRNDVDGYAKAMSEFDRHLPEIFEHLKSEDILIITADHGCDPGDISTDHTREYTPCLIYGQSVKRGVNLGTRSTFSDIGASVVDYFDIEQRIKGESMLQRILK